MHGEYTNLIESVVFGSIYPIEILSKTINEIAFDKLLSNTDKLRLQRAEKEVRTKPPSVVDIGDGFEKLVFNFKANPTEEKKRHKGYLIHKDGDVREMFCDCSDFFYRLYQPLVKAGLARYDLSDMFKYLLIKPHNKKPTRVTNPTGKLFVCKHLAAMRSYL